jgi:copper chaperone CopZ
MISKNIKREANEIRKIIEDVKGKFKEGTEGHKIKVQMETLEIKVSLNQIKIQLKASTTS